ncbi:hypothetical protein, partial [Mycobacteroides abscessus]
RALSCPPVGSSYWPRVGIFMSAYGQFFMSVDTTGIETELTNDDREWQHDAQSWQCHVSDGLSVDHLRSLLT